MEQLARFTREDAGGAWRVIAKAGLASGSKVEVAKRGKVATVTIGEPVRTLSSGEVVYAILRRTQAKAEGFGKAEQGRIDAGHNLHGGISIETDKGLAAEHGINTNGSTETMEQKAAQGSVDAAVKALIEATTAASKGAMDEGRVIELIQQHATKTVHTVHSLDLTKASGETVRVEGQHKLFAKLLAVVATGLPVMLVGPAGSGKTSAARAVAEALSKPFLFSGAVIDRFALLGFRDGNGRVIETQFSQAIKQACVFLWDEVDGSAEDALLSFHAPVDNRIADMPEGQVQVHEGCAFIASANTYGRGADRLYVGRNQLDAATLDRFVVIDWDYDLDLERNACSDRAWVARVQAVRAAIEALKVRHVVSMRATFQGAKLRAQGVLSQREIEDAVLWRGLDSDSRAKVERSL